MSRSAGSADRRAPVPEGPSLLLGWREWVALPGLGLPAVKAKIDTGARTSTLHAFYLESYRHRGERWVRFGVHPLQRRTDVVVHCTAPVLDRRTVRDSGGHRERRYVVATEVRIGTALWPVEMTLTNRDSMLFRMLLGRTAMRGRVRIDPGRSFLCGRERNAEAHYVQA
jgi:hypothetical protein